MQHAIEKRFSFHYPYVGGRGLSIATSVREPKYPPLAEPACRCSYPDCEAGAPGRWGKTNTGASG
jgi:hypothetical protein